MTGRGCPFAALDFTQEVMIGTAYVGRQNGDVRSLPPWAQQGVNLLAQLDREAREQAESTNDRPRGWGK